MLHETDKSKYVARGVAEKAIRWTTLSRVHTHTSRCAYTTLAAFSEFLRQSDFKSPTYIHAVIRENKDLRHPPVAPEDVKDILSAFERDQEEPEQDEPFSLDLLRKLFAACETDIDINTALVACGAFFTLSRIDSFLHLKKADINCVSDDCIRLTPTVLKGHKRVSDKPVEFERIDSEMPFTSCIGDIVCCPVAIMLILRDRAPSGSDSLVHFNSYDKYERSLKALMRKASIEYEPSEGRKRARYSTHSSRIGGVCTLLRAGLSESVISIVARWKSDMIKRYAERVVLMPTIVQPCKFYNPRALKNSYSGTATDSPSSKRRRVGK